MFIGKKRIHVPDKCGDFCPHYGNPIDMSAPCFRCPIFNCRKLENDFMGATPMVLPENFDSDTAQDYVDWCGESQLPEIRESE